MILFLKKLMKSTIYIIEGENMDFIEKFNLEKEVPTKINQVKI